MEFQLSSDQQSVFDLVDKTTDNILITGKPGVGKSVLIKALAENGDKTYTLSAPTGLAALNIGGKTLHSIFRVPTSKGILTEDFNRFSDDPDTIAYVRYRIKHLIIDEVSMVRADTLDYIDRMLKHVNGNDLAFGGIQIILIGDFYQLPPVTPKEEAYQLKLSGYGSPFAFSAKSFQNVFKYVELTEVLRQKGDDKFIKILHSARNGSISPLQVGELNKRVEKTQDTRIKLTSTNAIAESVNLSEMSKLSGNACTFLAVESGKWPAYPVEPILTLKEGAQIIIKKNGADRPQGKLDPTFKSVVVNGTLGIVLSLNDYKIVVKLQDGAIVSVYKQRWEMKVKLKEGEKWLEKVVASFEQFPISLAWAISIHKSQGQSFDRVHIDASKIFAPGQLYVALSRARTLIGVTLECPITPQKFWTDKNVSAFYKSVKMYNITDLSQVSKSDGKAINEKEG